MEETWKRGNCLRVKPYHWYLVHRTRRLSVF